MPCVVTIETLLFLLLMIKTNSSYPLTEKIVYPSVVDVSPGCYGHPNNCYSIITMTTIISQFQMPFTQQMV